MADREFLRNVLGLSSVDAGHGWLIFALGLDGPLKLIIDHIWGEPNKHTVVCWHPRICGGAHMNVDLAQELLNELGSSLEKLETQHAALLQFLKGNGILTDDQFAPYLAQADKASNVRWRAVRIRLESLFRNERQREETFKENELHKTGAGQAPPIQNQEREETKDDAGTAKPTPQSEEARINGGVEGAGKQSISEKDDKQDEHATSKDKKPSPPSTVT
jgi:hypothetical protein